MSPILPEERRLSCQRANALEESLPDEARGDTRRPVVVQITTWACAGGGAHVQAANGIGKVQGYHQVLQCPLQGGPRDTPDLELLPPGTQPPSCADKDETQRCHH